jgi:hypothetical protein
MLATDVASEFFFKLEGHRPRRQPPGAKYFFDRFDLLVAY